MLDKSLQLQLDFVFLAVSDPDQFGPIACCKWTQATDFQHRIKYGHAVSVCKRLRLNDLANDFDLTKCADWLRDNDVDLRRLYIFGQYLLDVSRELCRSLANGDHIF